MATGYNVPTSIGSYVMPKTSTHPFGPGVPWHMVNGVPVRGKSAAMIAKDATAATIARSAGLAGYYAGKPPTTAAPGKVGVIPGTTPGYGPGTKIGPGGTPVKTPAAPTKEDFENWLASDPTYQAGLTAYNTHMANAHNAFVQGIRQKLIAAGIVPDATSLAAELKSYGNGLDASVSEILDPTTVAAIGTNQLSTMSGLRTALAAGKQDLRYQLAARGLLGAANQASGAYAAGGSTLQNAFDIGSYNAGQGLIGDIGTGAGGYNTTLGAEDATLGGIRSDAATRWANLPV